MGYQERDYYRDEPSGAAMGIGVNSVVMRLVIINGVLFLADLFTSRTGDPEWHHWLTRLLSIKGDALVHPEMWYQFVTAGFVHSPENIGHILLNMIGLYSLGKPLEERFGGWEFLRFYLAAIVLSLLAWSIHNYFFVGPIVVAGKAVGWHSALGASGGVTATVLLFCLLYPRRTLLLMFAIPVPAWVAGLIVVASDLFGAKMPWQGDAPIAYQAHLAGATFALAYWYFGWNFGRLPGLATLSAKARKWGKLLQPPPADVKLHEPDDSYEDLDAEADRVLEKLHTQGESSLSKSERRVLEAYSRRMRQKHR